MLVEYNEKYDKNIKDLFIELQTYIMDLDKEGYNIVTEKYGEEYLKIVKMYLRENGGKILLYKENDKIVALIVGIINNEKEEVYDFKAPKRGKITDLIVSKEVRGKKIGSILLSAMEEYLAKEGCEDILLDVFAYNEKAYKFYKDKGYSERLISMSKILKE